MLNKTQQKEFEEMVNESIEDLSEPQCDEQSEPPSARYVGMDDVMVKPYSHEKKPLRQKTLDGEVDLSMARPGGKRSSIKKDEYEYVNKPKHYQLCGSETMPMIEQILGTEGYLAFLKGSALKYRFRASKKPGNSVEQDIAKAMYMENLYDNFVRENTP